MADPISILTQGTTISVKNAAGTTAIPIGGVMSITGIGSGSATEIEDTTLASVAKEFRQGLRDFGSFNIELRRRNEDDLGQAELYSMYALQATREFVITLPSSTDNVITLQGFVTQMTTEIAVDGIVGGTVTVRVTGAPAYS